MNEIEFSDKQRKTCNIKLCNYCCTTCPYDSEVVEKWRDHQKGVHHE